MKAARFVLIVLLFPFINPAHAQNFLKIEGRIADKSTGEPLPYATIYVKGLNVNSTSNDSGKFVFKIPNENQKDTLHISYIGYTTYSGSMEHLYGDTAVRIELEKKNIELQTVEIKPIEAKELVEKSISKIPENYDVIPTLLKAFYREESDFKSDTQDTAKQHYREIKEAVLDIYNTPYPLKDETADDDMIKLIAWRRIGKPSDTLLKKFIGGGPNSIVDFDMVKYKKNSNALAINPNSVLSKKEIKKYDFKFIGLDLYDNQRVYKIEFDQKDEVKDCLYSGTIYIDFNSLAFVSIEFSLSPKGMKYNEDHGMLGINITMLHFHQKMMYKKYDDKWDLNFLQVNADFKVIINKNFVTKSLFKNESKDKEKMEIMIQQKDQLAVTGINRTNVVKFEKNELYKSKTELKQTGTNKNEDVWGEDNYIRMQ